MRAVGPVVEPLGVLAHPGVVGRALQGVVERDLHAERPAPVHQGHEVVLGAQVGVDGGVAALGRADGPRAADVVGPGVEGVVAALAGGGADGVDRREVDHVEAHGGHGRQPARARRANPPSERGKNSYQLLWRARSRSTQSSWGDDAVRSSEIGIPATSGTSASSSAALRRTSMLQLVRRMLSTRFLDPAARGGGHLGCQRLEQQRALLELGADLDTGADLQPQLLAPGRRSGRSRPRRRTGGARCPGGPTRRPRGRCRSGAAGGSTTIVHRCVASAPDRRADRDRRGRSSPTPG